MVADKHAEKRPDGLNRVARYRVKLNMLCREGRRLSDKLTNARSRAHTAFAAFNDPLIPQTTKIDYGRMAKANLTDARRALRRHQASCTTCLKVD